MMDSHEKSDSAIVAGKSPNKAGQLAAEAMERRAEAKENANQQTTRRAQNRESVSRALERVRNVARQRKKERLTTLFHHITIDLLRLSFLALKRNAAAGVDGVTWRDYEGDLEQKLSDLHEKIHRGAYRAQPSRRRYIPKADGRQRPLAVAALEDKIVQRATAAVLNQIYEEDFLGFSYGFIRQIPVSGLKANIYWRRHNSELSGLAQLAIRFMTFLKEAQIGRAKSHFRSSTHSFDGRKFERWLLKVVLGMWGLGNLGGDGAALDRNPPEQLKLMMLGRELFPETWGLYMPGPIGPHYLNYGEVSVQPFTHPREDRVFAAQIGLGRVRFNLLLGTPDTPAIAGVRRPKSLSFHYPNPDFIFQTV